MSSKDSDHTLHGGDVGMTPKGHSPKNIPASIRARLLNISRERGEDFQSLLDRFARERLLYRLSQSQYRDRFILKGATLFAIWAEKPFRSTRDVDFLAFGSNEVEAVVAVFRDLCDIALHNSISDDGVKFDSSSVHGEQLRKEKGYNGVRIRITAHLDTARANVQIDVGFGDAVVPDAQYVELPVLLDLPAPRLRVYPKETVIAEKLQAMTVLTETNSRMKDFYDVWVLQNEFEFDGQTLAAAIKATFANRGTAVVPSSCVAFQASFYATDKLLARWRAYVQRGSFERVPPSFAEIGDAISAFLRPVAESIARGEPFDHIWPPGGPWQS